MNESYGTRSLREIVRIIFQHWLLLLLFVVVGAGGTYAVCEWGVTPTYRSRVSLIFKRPLSKSPISTDTGEKVLEVFVKAQQQIVMSDLVLARTKVIAEDKNLREQWYALETARDKARETNDGSLARAHRNILQFLTSDPDKDGTVANKVASLLETNQSEFTKFHDSVKLETPGGEAVALTESFTLTVDRPGPKGDPESFRAAQYAADVLAGMYIVRHQELQQELSDPALRVMRDAVGQLEREVEGKRLRYAEFVEKNVADIGVLEQLLKSGTEHGVQVVLTKIRENNATLHLELARDMAAHEVILEALPPKAFEAGGIGGMNLSEVSEAIARIPTDLLVDNVVFAKLVENIAKLEAKRAKVEAQYTEASRDLQYIRGEFDSSQRGLLRAIAAHAKGLEASIKARQQQKSMNEKLVASTAAEQNEIHKKLTLYARLKNDFQVAEKHLDRLEQERIDAMADSLRARESVTIRELDEPSVPDRNDPVMPKTIPYTLVAFFVSLLLGLANAFLLDHFDHTLRSIGEAERYLGVPVLGSVKKRGRWLVAGT